MTVSSLPTFGTRWGRTSGSIVFATSVRETKYFPSCSTTGKHNQLRAPLIIASLLPLTNSSGLLTVSKRILSPAPTTPAGNP
jgi:hypothetical protein